MNPITKPVAVFNCPQCQKQIQCPERVLKNGVECPQCQNFFVPEQYEMGESELSEEDQKWMEEKRKAYELQALEMDERNKREAALRFEGKIDALEGRAGLVSLIAALMAVISVIAGVCAFITDQEPGSRAVALEICGAFGSTAMALYIVAQLLHIRVALEKLAQK